MIQRGHRPRFAQESVDDRAIVDIAARQKFQRDPSAEYQVLGEIHVAHAPTAQLLDDAIMRKRLTDHFKTDVRAGPVYTAGRQLGCR